ncbi:MAG TPA: RsmE family RNA methyltransferase [Acidimicrobiales bacterium]|nr:RsmE family RNA methyltransferase [Acidimicrobiales bacterium]
MGAPALTPDDRHHLERVLRLRPGDELTVSDGMGGWRACRFGPTLEPMGEVQRAPRPDPQVTVGFAVVKGERPEWAVQKLTEIGVDRIVPLQAARSVVRWPLGEGGGQLARLRRVAREASVQSRRVWLPVVDAVTPVEALAGQPGAALAHRGGGAPSLDRPTILVGPEGGWDEAELGPAPALVGLGPSVLRTETAAVVAGALLCALRAGIVRSNRDPGG